MSNSAPPPYNPKQEEESFIPRESVYSGAINDPTTPTYTSYPTQSNPPQYSGQPQVNYYGQPPQSQPHPPYVSYAQQPDPYSKGPSPAYYNDAPYAYSSTAGSTSGSSDYSNKSYGTPAGTHELEEQRQTLLITEGYVYNCSVEVRMAFIRKVYIILFCQIALTMGVGALFMYVEDVKNWVQKNYWMIWVNLIPTLIVLFALIWKRKSSPANFILLVLFTILEGYSIGVIVTFYDEVIVLEALVVTVAIFLGLTLFTFQTKYDFKGFGPVLVAGLMGLLVLGILQIFFRNEILEIIYCCIGVIIFSGLILYDTQRIIKDTSPDEYIMASVNLYLDVLNLFLFVLRLFGRRG